MYRKQERIMNKKAVLVSLLIVMIFALCACSSVGDAIGGIFQDKGKVTLGEYKGIEVDPAEYISEITEQDIDSYAAQFMSTNFGSTAEADRPIQEGDTVNIDYVGSMNGVNFEGGSYEGWDLVIGSGEFIDGFEEGLIGAVKGEKRTLSLAFPTPYPKNPDFAGKAVVFEVTVNKISVETVPELNDEFVKTYLNMGSVEEFRAMARKYLEEYNAQNAQYAKQSLCWDIVMENATIDRYPEQEVKKVTERMMSVYENLAKEAEVTLDEYIKEYYGLSAEEFTKSAESYAKDEVGMLMVTGEIAKKENITVSASEYSEYLTAYINEYGYESDEAFKADYGMSFEEYYGKEELDNYFLSDKVMQFIADNAVEKAG